ILLFFEDPTVINGIVPGLLPAAACTTGNVHNLVEAAKTVFTDHISDAGADNWRNVTEKTCSDVDRTVTNETHQKISVVGHSFWDDENGTQPPRLVLSPIVALFDASAGD